MGQFKYGRNFKGKVVNLIPRYFGTSGPQCSHQHSPLFYHHTYAPSLYFSIFLSHPPTETHTHTHSNSLSISHSITSKPSIHPHLWLVPLKNPIRNLIWPLSQTLKVLIFLVMDVMTRLVDYVMPSCGKIGWLPR